MNRIIDLLTPGPSETEWAVLCDRLPAFIWPVCKRLVVVSPHPDDETFGAAGLLCGAVDRQLPATVVSVTDGEAANSWQIRLRDIRARELGRALSKLDRRHGIRRTALHIPDGGVSRASSALTQHLKQILREGDLVVSPIADDGHPDHDATGAAVLDVAGITNDVAVRMFPVWAWHSHEPTSPIFAGAQRFELTDDVLQRKRSAISQYKSQITGHPPVVPPWMISRLSRNFEVFVTP